MMPAPGIKLCAIAAYHLFPLSCTGFNFYWLEEVNRSIGGEEEEKEEGRKEEKMMMMKKKNKKKKKK